MFLLINKPKGITSHDVVDKIRKITGEKKVGHAGTLDPMATGLLIVAVSRESTKKLGLLLINKKEYLAEITLGEERETDDKEGYRVPISNFQFPIKTKISEPAISKILRSFVGEQKQVPPIYSAIKIKGRKAYEIARRGGEINLKSRKITIYSIKLLNYSYPKLKVRTEVSSGTYIRALARDIGRKLGCGAYLSDLVRTKIGNFKLESSVDLDKLNKDNWEKYVVSLKLNPKSKFQMSNDEYITHRTRFKTRLSSSF